MKTKSLIALLFISLYVLAVTVAQAMPPDKDKPRHKAMRMEILSYIDAQVMPVLKEKRATLETKLSSEDRTKIEALRSRLKALKGEKKDWKQEMREIRQKGELSDAQRTELKNLHGEMHVIMQEAKLIADKYAAEISALLNPLDTQKEQWKNDMKAIREKYKQEQPDSTQHRHHGKHKGGKRHGHGGKGLLHAHLKALKPTAFLLMSPNESESVIKSLMQEESKDNTPATPSNVFPNPTNSQSNIVYEVKTAGNVVIELLDANGKVIKTLVDEKKAVGSYQITVDVTDLTQPMYFYRITTPDSVEMQKLLVK
jgi:hypothetical protein